MKVIVMVLLGIREGLINDPNLTGHSHVDSNFHPTILGNYVYKSII